MDQHLWRDSLNWDEFKWRCLRMDNIRSNKRVGNVIFNTKNIFKNNLYENIIVTRQNYMK